MGLLDQILGGVMGRSSGGGGLGGALGGGGLGGLGGGLGGGIGRGGAMSSVLMSLLPVVLGMLANRGPGRSAASGLASEGAGAPGDLPGMGGMGGLGGLSSLIEQFTQKGYGDHARTWVGTGANRSLQPQALTDVFGEDQLADIASRAGVSTDEARHGLAELLPEVVDHFTPQGQLPPTDQLLASIDDYERRLPR